MTEYLNISLCISTSFVSDSFDSERGFISVPQSIASRTRMLICDQRALKRKGKCLQERCYAVDYSNGFRDIAPDQLGRWSRKGFNVESLEETVTVANDFSVQHKQAKWLSVASTDIQPLQLSTQCFSDSCRSMLNANSAYLDARSSSRQKDILTPTSRARFQSQYLELQSSHTTVS